MEALGRPVRERVDEAPPGFDCVEDFSASRRWPIDPRFQVPDTCPVDPLSPTEREGALPKGRPPGKYGVKSAKSARKSPRILSENWVVDLVEMGLTGLAKRGWMAYATCDTGHFL